MDYIVLSGITLIPYFAGVVGGQINTPLSYALTAGMSILFVCLINKWTKEY